MKRYFDPGLHYDFITEGWRFIFGDDFHLGYFRTSGDDLDTATDNLIEEMASLCDLGPETKILDAGCGIGAPAIFLHEKFGSDITGISTSRKGLALANEKIKGSLKKEKLRFFFADMTATGLPDESFDVIWVLESSHLIINKRLLFRECFRLLKPGGHILLADVLSRREYNFAFQLRHLFSLVNMVQTFGRGKTETPERYIALLHETGFKNLYVRDVSREMQPTFNAWRGNIIRNRNALMTVFGDREIKRFEKSIETFEYLFTQNLKCYYLFRAEK